jgi:hypothetical protein
MRSCLVVVLVLLSTVASASQVEVDLLGASTRPTADNPRSGALGVNLAGVATISEAVDLSAQLSYTRELATSSATTHSPGSNAFAGKVGVDLSLGTHLTLSFGVEGGPAATSQSATTVTITAPRTGKTTSNDVVLEATNTFYGVSLLGSWDTAGDSALEWSFLLGGQVDRFVTEQQLKGNATLTSTCAAAPNLRRCSLLTPQDSALVQGVLTAGVLATLFDDTDLSFDFAWYLYDQDPNDVGYYTVGVASRSFSAGTGVPVAPLAYRLKPQVAHRFGRLTGKLWYSYGRYQGLTGSVHAVGTRWQYRFPGGISVFGTASWQRDVAFDNTPSDSGSAVLGVKYSW